MKKKKVDYKVILGAIAALMIIELYALSKGINGLGMAAIAAMIAGLAGWTQPQPKFIKS